MNFNNLSKCIVLTSNNKEYYKIEDVPLNEYSLVHTVKDIHPEHFYDVKLFNKIKKWKNIRFISLDRKNYKNRNFINEIAIFQKLSLVMIIDYEYADFDVSINGSYIFKNKMLLLNPTNEQINNIPSNIEYLNIINEENQEYNNLPLNIKHLHILLKKKQ